MIVLRASPLETEGSGLTGAGVLVGTPQYMSPEQATGKRGDELDGRSDLYSLGVVMYHMLSGKLPFKADTTMAVIIAHMQKAPMDIREMRPDLNIPAPIASLVMKTLEKNPDNRPANARALIEEIDRAIAQVFPSVVSTGIRVHRRFNHGLPPLLMQRGHLSETLVNLLKNARDVLGEKGNVYVTADSHHALSMTLRKR